MKEQNLFLILFSGRPGRCLLISDHLLPILLQSSKMFRSSSSVHSSFFILGSSLLMNRSLICLPFLLPSISERSFQFLPYFLMSFLTVSSSSDDQILWLFPSWERRRYLWRHWFSFLSFMRAAISAHLLGYCWQRSSSWLSSSEFQVLTFLLVMCWFFCLTSMLMVFPSFESRLITNYFSILLQIDIANQSINLYHQPFSIFSYFSRN